MIVKPMDIAQQFPVRRKKEQKDAFRAAVCSYAESLGYCVTTESGNFGAQNIVIGDPSTAKYLVTAHYDTPGTIGIPYFCTPFNAFVFYTSSIVIVAVMLAVSLLCGVGIGFLAGHCEIAGIFSAAILLTLLFLHRFAPANKNNDNDNASGVVTLLEIAGSVPKSHRSRVCFVLFDLNEYGLIGSCSYRKAHKEQTENQIILNLDCVGDGDHICFIPTKKLRMDRRKLNPLYTCCGQFGNKFVSIRDKGFAKYPSDQNKFPYGVGIAALNQGKLGLNLTRIHTIRDTVLDPTNVNILRAAICTLISCDAAQ